MSTPRTFLLGGLTGGIATGKSTVSALFTHLGARVTDADQLAREVVAPGQPAHGAIVAEFGREVLQPDGYLDRKRLGAVVFADAAKRKRLEAITHPAIRTSGADIATATASVAYARLTAAGFLESPQTRPAAAIDGPMTLRMSTRKSVTGDAPGLTMKA